MSRYCCRTWKNQRYLVVEGKKNLVERADAAAADPAGLLPKTLQRLHGSDFLHFQTRPKNLPDGYPSSVRQSLTSPLV